MRLVAGAWLAAWWWCLGLVQGALLNAWIHRLTGGRWGVVLAPAIRSIARRMPWVLLLGAPLLFVLHPLYPWFGDDDAWTHGIAHTGFIRAWLDPRFFLVRLALYALTWWWLAHAIRRVGKAKRARHASIALLSQAVTITLASIDLLMSLTPTWTSSGFPLLTLVVQAQGGAALAVLLAVPRQPPSPVTRDLGNLLMMWTLLWAYLLYTQWLVLWAENLPREIAWMLPRTSGGWQAAGIALVLLQGVLPFAALLFRSIKDHPRRLARVAALILAGNALGVAWLVVPSVMPRSAAPETSHVAP